MNANPVHLDLDDLIAEAAGQGIDDQAREHLAGCEHCQREARRWNLVASGIRDLAAEAAEPAGPAEPARRPRTGRRGPWRRALLVAASAAAAFLVLVGIGVGAGLVHISVSGSGSQTSLTAFSGCAQLEQTAGTLQRVTGTGVVIKTPGGQLVTVTTTATTTLAASGALLGDITDGASVTVAGTSSGGTIAADYVVTGGNPSLTVPGITIVRGTVTDAGAAGFTVVTPAGARVPVTTSGDTVVTVFHAGLGQLQAGARTMAIGQAGPDGTLSARAVLQPPNWPAGAHASVSSRGCSPSAINHAILALASGG